MFRSTACFFSLLFIVAFIGCGSSSIRVEYVEGIVTLDGEPVSEATMTFLPKTETPPMEMATGMTDANGAYKVSSVTGKAVAGAVAGEYKVAISKVLITAKEVEYGAIRGPHDIQQTHLLPAIYADYQNTPLTATVNKGKNKIDFELKSKP